MLAMRDQPLLDLASKKVVKTLVAAIIEELACYASSCSTGFLRAPYSRYSHSSFSIEEFFCNAFLV